MFITFHHVVKGGKQTIANDKQHTNDNEFKQHDESPNSFYSIMRFVLQLCNDDTGTRLN